MPGHGDILPDSRPREVRGAVWRAGQGWWRPIFCANCGRPGGLVPQRACTFAFWLCDPCWETHGAIAATMAVPDEQFWAELAADPSSGA